jgi:hypothetical protein
MKRGKKNSARTAWRGNSFGGGLESLETRQMFSTSLVSFYTVPIGGTELVCQLNNPSERVTVVRSINGIQFNIDGIVENVAGRFSYLSIIDQSGDNSIEIGNNMTVPTCVWAGTGSDVISTGASDDSLHAGVGDDTLIALGGNDNVLFAGSGYTNIWETYSSTTDNYYYSGTGTLTTHFFSSFLNTSDISLDGNTIAEPGTDTEYTPSGNWGNVSNLPLFGTNGPQVSDINQGALGDCYYLSALAAIAHVDPQQIMNNVTALGDGTYAMEFYENGAPVYVRVDGYLPLADNGNLFYAGQGDNGSIWAAIMEKGFAYFESIEQGYSPDYGTIDTGGFSDPTLEVLLGTTASGTYNVATGEENFGMFGGNENVFAGWINWELQKGDAVQMAVNNGNSNDDFSIPGILENAHEYTVVSDTWNNSGQITGFWLRNPWGVDIEEDGTPELAAPGHNNGKDNGMVWVSVAEAWSVVSDLGAVAA